MFKRLVLLLSILLVLCGLAQQAPELNPECNVIEPCWVGDGWCDADVPGYNTEACGYDGGDCCQESCESGTKNREYPCGTCGYECVDPAYSGRQSNPSSSPSMNPTALPTRDPPRGTQHPTASSLSPLPTMAPSNPLPSSHPTDSPTGYRTQPPSAPVTEQPTSVSTNRPLHAPTQPPTPEPTLESSTAPTPLPTPIATVNPTPSATSLSTVVPSARPTLQPSFQRTSEPTSSAPTALPTPLRQVHFTFIAANTSANASLPRLSENETAAIFASLTIVLSNVTHQTVRVNVGSINLALVGTAPDRASLRRLATPRGPVSRWNISSLVTQVYGDDEALAVLTALNASLWDGSLQETLRAVSAAAVGAQSLHYAVLCPEANVETCGIPVDPAPSAGVDAQSCVRSSRRWDLLYASPLGFPWYLLWLGAQAVLWSAILLSAVCQLRHSRSETVCLLVTLQLVAGIHLAYIVLVLCDYAARQGKLACIEFEFVDLRGNQGDGALTLVLLLVRTMIYPATLSAIAGGVLLLTSRRPQLWWSMAPLAFIAGAASLLVVLFAVAVEDCDNQSPDFARTAIILQTICGGLAFLLPLPLCYTGRPAGPGGPRSYDNDRATTWDCALHPIETWQAAEEERRRDRASAREESAPISSPWLVCRLYCAATAYAGAATLTAVPQVLDAPASAFILYSVASRVLELYLAWLCLRVVTSRLRWATWDDAQFSDKLDWPHQLRNGTAAATAGTPGSGGNARPRPPGQGNSNSADINQEAEGGPASGACDGAAVSFWRKPWAWVFAPEADTPLGRLVWNSSADSTQETPGREEVQVGQGCPLDEGYVLTRLDSQGSDGSDSSDSTDSGREYFV